MAVNHTDQGYLLPCGRDVEDVWANLDGAGGEHERTCEYCQATRRSLTVLRDLTEQLVADETPPPRDLTGRIMAAVRADIRRHELLGESADGAGDDGGVLLSAQAVAAVLRFAADGVDGVRARRCRVTDAAGAEDGDRAIDVSMTVAVAFGRFRLTALDEVRARVAAAARAQVGVRLARLDLTVEDLYESGGHG